MSKLFPEEEEIIKLKSEYKTLLKVLYVSLKTLERQNLNDKRWFTFSDKIGTKFLNQAHTLDLIFSNGIFINEKRLIDFSSAFSLLRNQFENYAVFYHIFVDRECDMEENIVRFRLWELDGLKTKHNYKKTENTKIEEKLESEKKDIQSCIDIIKTIPFFINLSKVNQEYLIKFAAWKFTSESLKNKDFRKKKLSINEMILNTKVNKRSFQDFYTYSSTHIHTTYWSVIQNNTLTEREKSISEFISVMNANFLTSFFIHDLHKIFVIGENRLNDFSESEQKLIMEYYENGKKTCS